MTFLRYSDVDEGGGVTDFGFKLGVELDGGGTGEDDEDDVDVFTLESLDVDSSLTRSTVLGDRQLDDAGFAINLSLFSLSLSLYCW